MKRVFPGVRAASGRVGRRRTVGLLFEDGSG